MGNKEKECLVFGLDIGTRAVVGVVGQRDKNNFNVIGIESVEHDTRAMMDGQIHDIAKVAETVRIVKEKLEKKCNISLKNVCIAAAGRVLKTENVHVETEYNEDILVTDEHVYNLLSKGIDTAYKQFNEKNFGESKFYCVGKSVIKYYLNEVYISNLLNHRAKKLGADMICTFLPYEVIEGLYSAVEMAGLEVTNLTLEPIAAIELAIPDKFRMLNIALVDLGAGTSDICITREGSVCAYGMIPKAGDSLTEIIANFCLVEFNEAERIKKATEFEDVINYEDILGLSNSITKEEVLGLLESSIKALCKEISDEILRLNGDEKVGAVFVVGGGGKIAGFTDYLSECLDIAQNRVALRGEEVMNQIQFEDKSLKADSLLVTPLGICLHFYEENNSFINVSLNDDILKLYDNGKLTVVDAVMQAGIGNNLLFPQRGDSLVFTLNNEERIVKGELGESCVVYLNGDPANLHSSLRANDVIKIDFSTKGENGNISLSKLNSNTGKINITVNDMNVSLPNLCTVNGEVNLDSYKIQNGDVVEVLDYLTVGQILELMDLSVSPAQQVIVNNAKADMNTKVYSRFVIKITDKEELTYADLPDDDSIEDDIPQKDFKEITEKEKRNSFSKVSVLVNGENVIMDGKDNYVFVDIFDFYEFDLTKPKGDGIVTKINGHSAEFLESLHDGDVLEIYWKERD